MSWAAHDLEPYLFRAKFAALISLPLCLFGSYSPDIFTKWAVYGLDYSRSGGAGQRPRAAAPRVARAWASPTRSPSASLIAGIIFLASHNRMWAFSFLLGAWAHVFSDTLDSVGVMLFFPFTTWHAHLDVWEYVGEAGRKEDAIAYYTSLGGVWDLLWAGGWRSTGAMFTAEYFHREIVPRDTFWLWLRTKASDTMMLTVYRASAFFGVASIIGWYIWALLINDFHNTLDWRSAARSGRPARARPRSSRPAAARRSRRAQGPVGRTRPARSRRRCPAPRPRTSPGGRRRPAARGRARCTRRSVPQGSRGRGARGAALHAPVRACSAGAAGRRPGRSTRSVTAFEVSESTEMPSAGVAIGVARRAARRRSSRRCSPPRCRPERARAQQVGLVARAVVERVVREEDVVHAGAPQPGVVALRA